MQEQATRRLGIVSAARRFVYLFRLECTDVPPRPGRPPKRPGDFADLPLPDGSIVYSIRMHCIGRWLERIRVRWPSLVDPDSKQQIVAGVATRTSWEGARNYVLRSLAERYIKVLPEDKHQTSLVDIVEDAWKQLSAEDELVRGYQKAKECARLTADALSQTRGTKGLPPGGVAAIAIYACDMLERDRARLVKRYQGFVRAVHELNESEFVVALCESVCSITAETIAFRDQTPYLSTLQEVRKGTQPMREFYIMRVGHMKPRGLGERTNNSEKQIGSDVRT